MTPPLQVQDPASDNWRVETRNAPVTAKRPRKRRSDAIYPDAAARQRAYRARRREAREARWIERLDEINLDRLAAGLSPFRGRPNARFYGLLGNEKKKVKRAEREEQRTRARRGEW